VSEYPESWLTSHSKFYPLAPSAIRREVVVDVLARFACGNNVFSLSFSGEWSPHVQKPRVYDYSRPDV
jgi:hypothetical protein